MLALRNTLVLYITLLILVNADARCIKFHTWNWTVVCKNIQKISHELFGETFENVTNLIIYITGDSEVSTNPFRNIKKLQSIRIIGKQYNSGYYPTLRDIQESTFSNLPDLKEVGIEMCNMSILKNGIFRNVPEVKAIYFNTNITNIENKTFHDMPNLSILNLDRNELKWISSATLLTFPEKLETLSLSYNLLTAVTNQMLHKLSNLKFLNLACNNISVIELGSFEQTPNLVGLALDYNQLKQLDENIFPRSGMNFLKYVYLNHNRLMYLPTTFFIRAHNLIDIGIRANPWFCPCLTEIYRILDENEISTVWKVIKRPVCVVDRNVTDNTCRYTYSEELSEKYFKYANEYEEEK